MAERSDDDVLLEGLRMAMGIAVRAADQLDDLSPVQLRALTVLREISGANLAQLAEAMGVTVSTASRLVDRLIAAGLASRKTSAQTRREITLALTRTGRSTVQRYDRLRLEAAQACLEHAAPDVRAALIAALRQVVAAVPGVRESPPPA